MRKGTGAYTEDWPAIARRVKDEAGWICIRCNHGHHPKSGHTLTVHHLDMDKSNNAWWNLAALCQKCHLSIQAKVIMQRVWTFPHSEWFKIYVAGFYAFHAGLPHDRESVSARVDELIAMGQGVTA